MAHMVEEEFVNSLSFTAYGKYHITQSRRLETEKLLLGMLVNNHTFLDFLRPMFRACFSIYLL